MPCDNEDNVLAALLPLLTNGDDNRFRDALGLLLNAAMLLERQNHLRAAPHERTEQRDGYANGFKDKAFASRLGEIDVRVPQVCLRYAAVPSRSIRRVWRRGCGQSER